MSQTYSTRQRELSGGRLFSSRVSSVAPPPPAQASTPVVAAPPPQAEAPAPVVAPPLTLRFSLSPEGLATQAAKAAGGATGSVTLTGSPGSPYSLSATFSGLPALRDPAVRPTLWLISDLSVPANLAQADLALLPKGTALTGNRPGSVFTTDGNPATYGPNGNTVAVSIVPGPCVQGADGAWQVSGPVDLTTNQAYHPFAVLGPSALADINVALPSGTVARILTDLYMRPATVHPELTLRSHFAQRLQAIAHDVLTGPGAVQFLDGSQFTRAAVTLEGIVRGTARLMPTRETCVLKADACSRY